MSLVWHIALKDLRRLRWWLVAWAALHALPILIGWHVATHDPYGLAEWRLPDRMALFLGAQAVVAYLLTLILFEEDTVLGSQRFWLTRPMSGGRLGAAKAMAGAVVLVGIPILVALPWWIWCGLGLQSIAAAALEILVAAVVIGIPAAFVATVTDSLARALLWTFVLVAVAIVGFGGFGMVTALTAGNPDDVGVVVSRQIVLVAALLVEAGVAIAIQFRLRRTGVVLAVLAPLVVITAAAAARSTFRLDSPTPQQSNPERAAGISVRFDHAVMQPLPTKPELGQKREPNSHQMEAFFTPEGTPAGHLVMGIAAAQTWQWTEGTAIERHWLLQNYSDPSWALGTTIGLKFPGVDEETRNWWLHELVERRKAMEERRRRLNRPPPEAAGVRLGGWPLATPDIAAGQRVTLGAVAYVPTSIAARMNREPSRYEAKLWMTLVRPQLAFEAPLESTEWRRGPGGKMRVAQTDRHGDLATLTVVGTSRRGLLDRVRSGSLARGWWDLNYAVRSRTGPVVINRRRGEIRPAGPYNERVVTIAGVDVQWMKLDAFGGRVIRSGKEVFRPGWLDGATLGVLYWEPESIFARSVKVDKLLVEEQRRGGPER